MSGDHGDGMRIVADLLRQKGDIARERDEALARVAALEAALGVSCDRLGSLRPGEDYLPPEKVAALDHALADVQRQIRAALSAPGATSPEHAATTTADFDPVRAENFGLRARLTAAVKILAEHGLALGQADFDQARAALAAHDAAADVRAAALCDSTASGERDALRTRLAEVTREREDALLDVAGSEAEEDRKSVV